MLRITIELVPFGDEEHKRKIAEMVIANTGDGTGYFDSYIGWTAPDSWSGETNWFGRIKKYDRSKSAWELVRLMLNNMSKKKSIPNQEEKSLSQFLKKKLL